MFRVRTGGRGRSLSGGGFWRQWGRRKKALLVSRQDVNFMSHLLILLHLEARYSQNAISSGLFYNMRTSVVLKDISGPVL